MSRSSNLTSLHIIENRQITNIHDINDSLSGRQLETFIETMLLNPKISKYIPKYTGRTKKKGVLFLNGDISSNVTSQNERKGN